MALGAAKKVLRREFDELIELLPNRMPGGANGEPLEPLVNAAEVLNRLQDIRARLDHCPEVKATLESLADAVFERTKPGSEFAALCLEVQSCLPQKVDLTLSTGLAGINDLSRVKSSEFLNAIESLRSVGHDANGYLGFQSTDELRVIEQRVRNLREDKRLNELTAMVPSLVEQLDRLREAAKAIWSDPELTDIEVVSMLLDCRNPESELSAMLQNPLMAGVAAYRLSRMLGRLNSVTMAGSGVKTKQSTRRKSKSRTEPSKLELVKRLLLARHCRDEPTDETRCHLSTQEIEDLTDKMVSKATAGRCLKELFRGDIAIYREACQKGTVAFFVQGLGEAQKTIGTTDPAVLAEMVTYDGKVVHRSRHPDAE